MLGYFKPLRRKIGVATLLIACSFMAGWMRSQTILDSYIFAVNDRQHQMVSFRGRMLWMSGLNPGGTMTGGRMITSTWDRLPYLPSVPESSDDVQTVLMNNTWQDFQKWSSTHLSFVIPLTMLAAWLLLSKPRTKRTDSRQLPTTQVLK